MDRIRMQSLLLVAMFVGLTSALALVAPGALRLGFPALAFVAACFLFVRSRTHYIQFVFWLWFLSPWLRRFVDYRTEYTANSPLLVAPLIATAVSGLVLLRNFRSLARPAAAAFATGLAAVLFGTVYGFMRYAPMDVMRGFVSWPAPILFGFFLYQERDRFEEYRDVITRSLLWGTLLTGFYGIVQFFFLPVWDESWMLGLNSGAFGEPFARQVRVYSTMNSPANFATYLVAGLLISFTVLMEQRGRERVLAALTAPIGLIALLLTASRSLWIGFVAGVGYLALMLPARARLRLAGSLVVALILGAFATQLPGINEVVTARVKSFGSGSADVSYRARVDGHRDAFATLAREPLGEGMGSADKDHATDGSDDRLGPHDSTLLEFLYALGWPGTLVSLLGLAAGLTRILLWRAGGEAASQPFNLAVRAILVGLFAQSILTSMMIGVPGFLVWLCLGMGLAATDLQPALSRVRASARLAGVPA